MDFFEKTPFPKDPFFRTRKLLRACLKAPALTGYIRDAQTMILNSMSPTRRQMLANNMTRYLIPNSVFPGCRPTS